MYTLYSLIYTCTSTQFQYISIYYLFILLAYDIFEYYVHCVLSYTESMEIIILITHHYSLLNKTLFYKARILIVSNSTGI